MTLILQAPTSTGASLATHADTSTEHFQLVKLAYGSTSAFNVVTTAAPLPTLLSTGSIPTVVVTTSAGWGAVQTVVSASSGLVQISGTVVSASSGLVQISGTATIVSASSGLVQISGTPAVTSTSVVLSTAGATQISGTVTVVSASSGLVQISGTPAVTITSGTVTLSSAHIVSLSSGTVTLSSNPTVISASSGLVQISGTATIVSASSGLVQISGTPTVTATAATNPWSSAPSFNVPMVSASSGLVQISGTPTILSASSGVVQAQPAAVHTSSGLDSHTYFCTGAPVAQVITTAPASIYGWSIYNSTATIRGVKVYRSTNPTIGSTTALAIGILVPGSTGGGGSNYASPYPIYSTAGLSVVVTANSNATDTGAAGLNDVITNIFYRT